MNSYNSLTVVLDKDIREEDAGSIISAILQFKNVISVHGNISDPDAHTAERRARHKLGKEIIDILYPEDQVYKP